MPFSLPLNLSFLSYVSRIKFLLISLHGLALIQTEAESKYLFLLEYYILNPHKT